MSILKKLGELMARIKAFFFQGPAKAPTTEAPQTNALVAGRYQPNAAFYGATVVADNLLLASLFDSSAAFYGPTITSGTTLVAPLFTGSASFHAPTLSLSLVSAIYQPSATFHGPTITTGTAIVAPLFAPDASFHASSIGLNLVASLVSPSATFHGGAVTNTNALAASLFAPSATFYSPAIGLRLVAPHVTANATFRTATISLGQLPGYALSTPGVTVTSAAGDAPEIDLTINSDHYAGYYLDIQRSTTGTKNVTDGSYTSPTLNISHQITPMEIAALAITNTDLAPDGYIDPSGAYFQQYRIRREDGALSAWVEISGTVTASVAVLYDQTGVNKSQYLSVSGTPKLVATGTSSVGAAMCARATVSATGKRQFEVTVTSYGSNHIAIGVENGATNLNSGFPAPGITNANGVGLRMNGSGFSIWRSGSTVSSGSTNAATGDVLTMIFDTAAGTASFYRTRSGSTIQIGSTVTGISLSAWNAYLGAWSNSTLTANFGASSFTRALDTGYSLYG